MREVVSTGNALVARAAVECGCNFFGGYPITPSSEIAHELSCGRLVRLGREGLREILELNLSENEQEQLSKSEAEIRKNIKFLKENLE